MERAECILGNNTPATPKVGQRHIAVLVVRRDAKSLLNLVQMLRDLPLLDDGALLAGPGAEAAANGPTLEVFFALLSRYPLYSSENSDGAMDLAPEEDKSGAGISIELV